MLQKRSSHEAVVVHALRIYKAKWEKDKEEEVGRSVNRLFERWQSNTVLFHDMLINSCGPWVSATDRRHAHVSGPSVEEVHVKTAAMYGR